MVDASMSTSLQIPTVTYEDLHNFHARVFGSPAPKHLFQPAKEPQEDAPYENNLQEEDDDLGYYPDGVKRTLTDDQIAMFRHSEIYSILRERQVRKENLEAEGVEGLESMDLQPEEAVKAAAPSDEEGEVLSDGEVKDVFSTVSETAPQHMEATPARKKRKIRDADTGYEHGRKYASRSARGLVRDLDSTTAEDQILDYGDEPLIAERSENSEAVARRVAEQDPESQARPVEGKKIWWPTIDAT